MADEQSAGFPNRPDVPEFWNLSEVIIAHDAQAETQADMVAGVNAVIPVEVLEYVAEERSKVAMHDLLHVPPEAIAAKVFVLTSADELHNVVCVAWADAFMCGAEYQAKHGKKD